MRFFLLKKMKFFIRDTGFTLVELLLVITITGLLASLSMAAVKGATDKARTTKCLSNLRQVGIAVQLYVSENQGSLPDTSHAGFELSWTNTLAPYLTTNYLGKCPSAQHAITKVTYAWNDLLTEQITPNTGRGLPINRLRSPSATLALAELPDDAVSEHFHFAGERRLTPTVFRNSVEVERHGQSANYLFTDGHAETISWPSAQSRLKAPNSAFLQP